MYKNLQILNTSSNENLNSLVEISNTYYANSFTYDANNIIPNNSKPFSTKDKNMDEVYGEFINLGKLIFNNSDGIIPYEVDNYFSIAFTPGKLIKYKDDEQEKRNIKILYDWLNTEPSLKKPFNVDVFRDEFPNLKVDAKIFCDLAVFSYIINSALAHYFIYNSSADKKKYYKNAIDHIDNKVTIDSILKSKKNDKEKINDFYIMLDMLITTYENYYKDKIISTILKFQFKPKKIPSFKRCYCNITSFYWDVLKLQIYSMANDYCVVNICRCGNVITGKYKLCPGCKKINEALRKQKEREEKKREKEKHE